MPHRNRPIAAPCPSHKHSYLSLAKARSAGRAAQTKTGKPMGTYRCHDCRQYHLTSQPKYRKGTP